MRGGYDGAGEDVGEEGGVLDPLEERLGERGVAGDGRQGGE